MAGYIRKRFLLYPAIRIAKFMQRDRDNSNAHSVVYVCTAHAVPFLHILHSVGILFLNSFLQGVWRCPIAMNGTKSHASLMPFWLTNLIIFYMSEQGVIVLNRMYSGEYLDENLGHEIINLYKSDNGRFFLYLNALGTFDKKWTNKIKTMFLVRTIRGTKQLEVLGVATDLTDVYKYGDVNQKEFIELNNIKYAGKFLHEIFISNKKQQDICITFEAKKVLLPAKKIILSFDENTFEQNKSNLCVLKIYGINQAKASLKQYIDVSDTIFSKLQSLINDPSLWNGEAQRIYPDGFDMNDDTYFDICGVKYSELAYSNALAYFFKKYPCLLSSLLEKECGIDFDISNGISVYREKRNIDLLITNGKESLVIENKIKSGINGIDKKDPKKNQLDKYYKLFQKNKKETEEEISFRKQFPNPHFFVFTPNYNDIDLNQYESGRFYSSIKYSQLYNCFLKQKVYETDCLVKDFVDSLKTHSGDYCNDLYEAMKSRFLQIIQTKN